MSHLPPVHGSLPLIHSHCAVFFSLTVRSYYQVFARLCVEYISHQILILSYKQAALHVFLQRQVEIFAPAGYCIDETAKETSLHAQSPLLVEERSQLVVSIYVRLHVGPSYAPLTLIMALLNTSRSVLESSSHMARTRSESGHPLPLTTGHLSRCDG